MVSFLVLLHSFIFIVIIHGFSDNYCISCSDPLLGYWKDKGNHLISVEDFRLLDQIDNTTKVYWYKVYNEYPLHWMKGEAILTIEICDTNRTTCQFHYNLTVRTPTERIWNYVGVQMNNGLIAWEDGIEEWRFIAGYTPKDRQRAHLFNLQNIEKREEILLSKEQNLLMYRMNLTPKAMVDILKTVVNSTKLLNTGECFVSEWSAWSLCDNTTNGNTTENMYAWRSRERLILYKRNNYDLKEICPPLQEKEFCDPCLENNRIENGISVDEMIEILF